MDDDVVQDEGVEVGQWTDAGSGTASSGPIPNGEGKSINQPNANEAPGAERPTRPLTRAPGTGTRGMKPAPSPQTCGELW